MVHFSIVSLASHFTPQGEVDPMSSLTIKIDPGTSKAKKEDLDLWRSKKVHMKIPWEKGKLNNN